MLLTLKTWLRPSSKEKQMLIKKGNLWVASNDLHIEKIKEVVTADTPFGDVNVTIVGSAVSMHDDQTVIRKHFADVANKEPSLVEILKLHKTQCDLFAFFKPGESNGVPMSLARVLIDLGEDDTSSITDWVPIVFSNGEWKHEHEKSTITLERRCVHGGWFTRYTLTEILKINKFPNNTPYMTSRTETITLRDDVPAPVVPEEAVKMFFVTDPETI